MSSLNTLSGRNGEHVVAATRVARITQWNVNPTLATTSEWGDSDSAGYTNRFGGRRDGTFTSEGKYDSTSEVWTLFAPDGTIVLSTLWFGVAAGQYYHFPRALCLDFSLVVNVDTEEVLGWTSSWGADGIYYAPGDPGGAGEVLP